MKWLIDDTKLRMAFSLLRKNPDTDVNTLIKLIAETAPNERLNPLKTIEIKQSDLESVQQGLFEESYLEELEEKGVKYPENYAEKVKQKQKRKEGNEPKSRQHWTRNEEEELIAMKHSGRHNKEIAKVLQRSQKAVSQKVRKLVKEKRLDKDVQFSRWYTDQEKRQLQRCYEKYGSAKAVPENVIESIAKQMKRKQNAILDQFYSIEREERKNK